MFLCTDYSVRRGFLPRIRNTRSRIQQMDVPANTQIIPTMSISELLVKAPLIIRYKAQIISRPGRAKMIFKIRGSSSNDLIRSIMKSPFK